MSTVKLTTFRVDGQLFGLPVERVQEVTRFHAMTPVPMAPPSLVGLINLRGEVLTAIDLRARLDYPPRDAGQLPINLVLRGEGVALLADSFEMVVDVDTDDFESPPDTLTGPLRQLIHGAYKLEIGLLLELDPSRLVELEVAS
ncbi:MAG: cheW [Frankiales bacterium]|nr:cheW [Frankiales bacterium]